MAKLTVINRASVLLTPEDIDEAIRCYVEQNFAEYQPGAVVWSIEQGSCPEYDDYGRTGNTGPYVAPRITGVTVQLVKNSK